MSEAKSALPASSLKPMVGGLAEADEKYKAALERITSALDAREQRSYDPMLMSIAQGFFAPSATGSFGESLGNVAGNINKTQQQLQGEAMESAKMRLQLAQSEREQAGKSQAASAFRSIAGGQPQAGVPGVPGAPATPGVPGAPGAPAQAAKAITMQDVMRFAASHPDQKDMIGVLTAAAKAGSDRYKIAMNGTVFDTETGGYLDKEIPGQKAEKYTIPELGGELSMTPYEYSQYRSAKGKGQARMWLQDFMAAEPQGGKPSGGPKTAGQIEAESAAMKEKAVGAAKGETGRTESVFANAEDAGSRLATYQNLKTLVKRPGMEKVFGIFERPDFAAALGKLAESGIGVTGFTIGIPEIRKVMTNIGLDQNLINDAEVAASLMAQIQFSFSSLAKGQGAISDFERRMFNTMGTSFSDNVASVIKKMDLLSERAKFERDFARELRKSKISADEFKDSDRYTDMVAAYQDRLQNIIAPSKASGTKPATGNFSAEDAKVLLRKKP
jgi:hypothetical protein